MIDLLRGGLLLALGLWWPGVALVRALAPELRGAVLHIAGFAAGAAVVPTLAFALAMALRTHMHPALLLATGALVGVPAWWVARRDDRAGRRDPD